MCNINYLIFIFIVLDKCLEVILKFRLELYSNHTLKNLLDKHELELSLVQLK